mmetsp:Transcript_56783/g.157177  ORF Transcript_56783/g.157177 Transcript_56783/m.157177 type:complete len:245 (-) Transcript_56783:77-811(-)
MPYQELSATAGSAAGQAADKATQAVDTMTNGNAPVRLLATVGLAAMVWGNFCHFLNIFQALKHPFDSLTQGYLVIAGLVCLTLEGVDLLCCLSGLRNYITSTFPFLDRTGGRGVTYFVLGSLTASEGGWSLNGLIQIISGLFLMFIGVMAALIARAAKRRLDEIGDSQAAEALKLFPEYAKDREGNEPVLHAEGLAAICEKLGKPLTPNQAAAALTMMDADHSGGISQAEFKVFWQKLAHEALA